MMHRALQTFESINTSMNVESFFDPTRNISPLVASVASLLIIFADLITAAEVMLSIFFVLPIIIAGWYNGLRWAILLSIALPLLRFLIATYLEPLWEVSYNFINAVDRMVVLGIVSVITAKLSLSVRKLQTEVKVLEGLLPICANCKMIRDSELEWHPLEKHITERSKAEFTHGICPACIERLYGDMLIGKKG